MRTITTLIAIAAFSLHIMLGCCWHHAHGANCPPGHSHGPQVYDHVHGPGGEVIPIGSLRTGHSHEQETSSESVPVAPEQCSDPQCIYLHADQLDVPPVSDVAPLPVLPSEQVINAHSVSRFSKLDQRGKYPPHVRRHLALLHFLN